MLLNKSKIPSENSQIFYSRITGIEVIKEDTEISLVTEENLVCKNSEGSSLGIGNLTNCSDLFNDSNLPIRHSDSYIKEQEKNLLAIVHAGDSVPSK
jgi:hypothetical protein